MSIHEEMVKFCDIKNVAQHLQNNTKTYFLWLVVVCLLLSIYFPVMKKMDMNLVRRLEPSIASYAKLRLVNTSSISLRMRQQLTDSDIKDACNDIAISYDRTVTSKQRCLIYNMVPKCGSAGTRNLIMNLRQKLNYYSSEGPYTYPGSMKRFRHKPATMKRVLKVMQGRCIKNAKRGKKYIYYRHQYFSNYSLIRAITPFYTNLIRDPVDHYVSWFYYRRYGETGRTALIPLGGKIQRQMTFDECVQGNNKECNSPLYIYNIIPYFCGNEEFCLQPSEKSLIQAKRNVVKHFPVVGYLENYERYLELCEYFWPQFYKGAVDYNRKRHKNGTHKTDSSGNKRKKLEPSENSKLIMKTRMPLDYDFYNWIKKRFACQYKKYLQKNVVDD